MDGVRPATAGRLNDFRSVQVGLRGGGSGSDRKRLVGVADMQGMAIRLAEHRRGENAQFPARSENAHGDLAPVGDQYFANGLGVHAAQPRCGLRPGPLFVRKCLDASMYDVFAGRNARETPCPMGDRKCANATAMYGSTPCEGEHVKQTYS